MKYRKKPVVIDAVQLRRDTWNEICKFIDVGRLIDGKPEGCYIDSAGFPTTSPTDTMGLSIPTLEGVMLAKQNDWIIKGVNGEIYACKPDIFEKTYEVV